MLFKRRSAIALTVLGGLVAIAAHGEEDARADDRRVVPMGGGLPPMSIEVDLANAVIRSRTCRGSPCDGPLHETKIDLAREDMPDAAAVKIEVISVGEGKQIARVRVPVRSDSARAFEALLSAQEGPAIFEGRTGFFGDSPPGDREGTFITVTAGEGNAHWIIVSGNAENSHICGQSSTPLNPRGLETKTLTLVRATLRFPKAARDAASPIVAVRAKDDAPLPLVSPLSIGSTSGGNAHALVDDDPKTAWIETRPNDGHGEFVTFRTGPGILVDRLRLVVAPSVLPENYAAPRTFFVTTNEGAYEVTMPEDAAMHPGAAYDVTLPKPTATDCISLVLDTAYSQNVKAPNVGFAGAIAFTEFDKPIANGANGSAPATLDDVALALRGNDARANEAASLLGRAGKMGISAIDHVYEKLEVDGKLLAVEAASGASCEDAAPFFVRVLSDSDRRLQAQAEKRIERCGKRAGPALAAALPSATGTAAARISDYLATVDPREALAPLAARLGQGDAAARNATRRALAVAARNAEGPKLVAVLATLTKSDAKLEFFRAIAARAGDLDAEVIASLLDLASAPTTDFSTRYLLAPAVASLAEKSDARAATLLESWVASAREWPLRAHAAEVLPQNIAPNSLVKACTDEEPRVREAALAHASELAVTSLAPCARASMKSDPWPFVRLAAIHDLTVIPADRAIDHDLALALTDPSIEVRVGAAHALAAHRAKDEAPALLARLSDPKEDGTVRRASALALGASCASVAADKLTTLAKDAIYPENVGANVDLAMASIEALGMLKPSDLSKRLAPALAKDSPERARVAASRALEATSTCKP